MRTARRIGASQVSKRRLSLTPVDEAADSLYLRNIAVNSIKHGNSTAKNDIMKFFRGTANYKSANKNSAYCLNMIKRLDENDQFNDYTHTLASYMASDIVPFISDLKEFSRILDNEGLREELHDIIQEAIYVNDTCDGIMRNDENIKKRFNVDRYIKENAFRPVPIVAIDICQMIDTFKSSPGVKFRVALEEICYLFENSGIEYDRKDMVKAITEYFLHREQSSDPKTFNDYRIVLSESAVITDDDVAGVGYFLKEEVEDVPAVKEPEIGELLPGFTDHKQVSMYHDNPVLTLLDAFKASEDKREEALFAMIDHINECKDDDIITALPSIMEWIRHFALNSLYNNDVLKQVWKKVVAHFMDEQLSPERFQYINSIFQEEVDRISHTIEAVEASDDDALIVYFDTLKKIVACIEDYIEMYTNSDTIKKNLGINNDSGEVYSTDKFSEVCLRDIGKFCTKVSNEFNSRNNTYANIIKENTDTMLWSEKDFAEIAADKSGYLDCVTENGVFDHVLAIFDVKNHDNIASVREAVEKFCRQMNSKSNHLYYDIVDSIIELHVENENVIDLSYLEMEERNNTVTEAEYTYFGMLESLIETNDTFCDVDEATLMENFALLEDYMTADDVCGVIELSTVMGGLISYERLNEIAERYHINHPDDYYGNTQINTAIDQWSLQCADVSIMAEAVTLLNETLLNEISFKVKSNKDTADSKPDKEEKGNEKESSGAKRSEVGNARDKAGEDRKEREADKTGKGNSDKVKDNKEEEKEENKSKKDKFNLNTLKFAAINLKKKSQQLDTKTKEISKEIDMQANRFMKAVKDLYTNDNRESIIRGSIVPSFHKLFQRAVVGAVGTGVVAIINPAAAIATAALYVFSLIAVSKHNTDKERALLLDEIDIELDVIEKEIHRAEEQNKLKNYRRLVAHKKKLQRERARIKYRAKYRDFVVHDLPDKEE